jgi:P-type E1-E2 ATPase
MDEAEEIAERPFEGLHGTVTGRRVRVTNRKYLAAAFPEEAAQLPPVAGGLECVILVDDHYAATYRFRDTPRAESTSFLGHLGPKHLFDRTILLSGDRESEVRYLADEVGISELHAGKSPEEKVAIVREQTAKAKTIFVGDGINDAPALMAATVGIAFGQPSEITTEAAGAVIMDSSLTRVDEFFHISQRMRRIALESALGGMILSVAGMAVAAAGYLTPVAGAISQEVIDLAAVLNALRAAWPPRELTDF